MLRACAHVLRLLGESGATRRELEESYSAVASGGIFTSETFREAQAYLLDQDYIRLDQGRIKRNLPEQVSLVAEDQGAEQLARWILLKHPPLWLRNAVSNGTLSTELIPSEVADRLEGIFPSAAEREAILLAAAQQHDDAMSLAAGALGEEHVSSECERWLRETGRPDLAAQVQRVSLVSDRLGYDVSAPDLGGTARQLEVKACSGPGLRFFLTRNEFNVGSKFLTWSLVIVRVDLRTQEATVAGWCSASAIKDLLPTDRDDNAKWEVAMVRLPADALHPGLPIQTATLGH